jgi:hypothetical protein
MKINAKLVIIQVLQSLKDPKHDITTPIEAENEGADGTKGKYFYVQTVAPSMKRTVDGRVFNVGQGLKSLPFCVFEKGDRPLLFNAVQSALANEDNYTIIVEDKVLEIKPEVYAEEAETIVEATGFYYKMPNPRYTGPKGTEPEFIMNSRTKEPTLRNTVQAVIFKSETSDSDDKPDIAELIMQRLKNAIKEDWKVKEKPLLADGNTAE